MYLLFIFIYLFIFYFILFFYYYYWFFIYLFNILLEDKNLDNIGQLYGEIFGVPGKPSTFIRLLLAVGVTPLASNWGYRGLTPTRDQQK